MKCTYLIYHPIYLYNVSFVRLEYIQWQKHARESLAAYSGKTSYSIVLILFMQASIVSYYYRKLKYILCMFSLKEYKISSIYKGVHFSFLGELAAMK